jgi:dihydroorotate dehydrogenase
MANIQRSAIDSVKLTSSERITLLRGMLNVRTFIEQARPLLYSKFGGVDDKNAPENVHDFVIKSLGMQSTELAFRMLSPFFKPPKELIIMVKGRLVCPFGTAAGLDKNGEAIGSLSHVFGFQEPGTVIIPERKGNDKPRVAVDLHTGTMFNAQGFPSKGLEHFIDKITKYRLRRGDGVIYVSICGLPISTENVINTAMKQMETLLIRLVPYVDGFVWNPYSPNTEALKLLRTPSVFFDTAQIMTGCALHKLRLVKIGPYEPEDKDMALRLVRKFMDGGGHGVVTPNTYLVRKDMLPAYVREDWGYGSAGTSGPILKGYRMRSVTDVRQEFPESIIIANGDISDWREAYNTFMAGATMLGGYKPYTLNGLGLLREMQRDVAKLIRSGGFRDLAELQAYAKTVKVQNRYLWKGNPNEI